jgi:PAS domain S-box-containing protein
MVNTGRLIWPVQRRDDFLRIVVYIALSTALIFVFDTLTPLGLVNWILYLIPLFLTVYISWKYAPFVMTGIFIVLMAVSLFLSPRDVSLELALFNRVFFAIILVIASVFIEQYVANVEGLAMNEERYRNLIEWLPEGIIVYLQGEIVYVNPAGLRLFAADCKEDLTGRDIIGMIDQGLRAIFRERVAQAELGAHMNIEKVRLIRPDGSDVVVGMTLGSVFWDRKTAVQIVMRDTCGS